MESIYRENLEALSKNYGERYVEKLLNKETQDEEVASEISAEGNVAIKLKKDGKEMYINSRYSPAKEAQRFADGIKDYDSETIFFVFGMGPGYHIREMLKFIGEKNRIIVVEPSVGILRKALETCLLTDIIESNKVYIFSGRDRDELKLVFSKFIASANLNNFQQLVFSKYDRFYESFYTEYINDFKEYIISNKILINTINYFSYEFNKNLFFNMSSIIDGYALQELKGKFSGIPAIIVSAGPSLDKNIKDLAAAVGKSVILSGGRTVRALQENGIKPDFIVSIDPGDNAHKLVTGRLEEDVPLITTIISNEKVIKEHKGIKFFSGNRGHREFIKYLKGEDLHILPQGGSVAHTCLGCADYMGCDPIIFIGQDLAYTNGKYHAESTRTLWRVYDKSIAELEVDGINGGKVQTSHLWMTFLKWIEAYIHATKEKYFINATEGGANIKGTEVAALKETISRYCNKDIDIKGIIENAVQPSRKDESIYTECIEKLQILEEELEEVKRQAQKGLELCNDMLGYYERGKKLNISKVLGKLDDIDKRILKYEVNNTAINDLISPTLLKVSLNKAFNEKLDESERERGTRLAKKSKALYEGTVKAVEEMPVLIEKAVSDIKDVIAERENKNGQ